MYIYCIYFPLVKKKLQMNFSRQNDGYFRNCHYPYYANFSGDASAVIALQGALKFNGGGHINHSIFWQNLCPTSDSGEPSPELMAAIERDFGSLDVLKEKLSASTVAVQGSGNLHLSGHLV